VGLAEASQRAIQKVTDAIKDMDDLTQRICRRCKKSDTGSDEFEELDLSEFSSIDEQIEFLKRQDRIDTMYIT
jgi:hypothetical protein